MKPALAFFLVFLSMATHAEKPTEPEPREPFDSAMSQLENQVAQLSFVPVQLDFAAWLSQQQRALQQTTQQQQIKASSPEEASTSLIQLANWRQLAANMQPDTPCQHMRVDNLMLQLTLLENRQKLVEQLPPSSRYSGSFANFPDGKAWYLHWLNAWLLLDDNGGVTHEHVHMLQEMALEELQAVHPEFLQRVAEANARKQIVYAKSDGEEIVAALRKREEQVLANLSRVFADLPDFPQVHIQPSSLPASFPAPGIYDYQNQVFYYHFTKNTLQARSLDWLYLHEAVPGHHMQMSLANELPVCPASRFMAQPMVTIEGWGAWVETLGQELGLYKEPASQAYALQWRVLRALRVLMDIGIHYEGWDDNKAMSFWLTWFGHQILPSSEDIGKREIARIHRWPVQVITYVYGKHLIETAITRLGADASDIDKKHIHSALLQLSNQPPHALKWLPQLLKSKKIQ